MNEIKQCISCRKIFNKGDTIKIRLGESEEYCNNHPDNIWIPLKNIEPKKKFGEELLK